MANICCDDVCFFSDDNPEGIASLWKDLETAITPGYKDDLGSIRRLFLHAGIATDGISLRGTIMDMEKMIPVSFSLWIPHGVRSMMRIQRLRTPMAFPLSCGAWSQAAAFSIIRIIPGIPFRTDTA